MQVSQTTRPAAASAAPIRTLIVDDEVFARQRLRELCEQDGSITVLGECAHGEEALREIERLEPDLLLLDVQMRGTSGFDVMEKLRGRSSPLVVFVTAYEQYALDAFDADAVDYLLKPFEADRFQRAMARVRARLAAGAANNLRTEITEAVRDELKGVPGATNGARPARRIIAHRDERLAFIDPQDIDCIEADRNYISIRVNGDSYRLRCTMQQAEAMLDPTCFLRIHRSVIVNSMKIREMERWFHGEYVIRLKSGQRFVSGRGYRKRIQNYMKNGLR